MHNSKLCAISPNFLHLALIFAGFLTLNFYLCAADTKAGPLRFSSEQSWRWTGEHVGIFEGHTYIHVHEPRLSWENAWLACQAEGLTLTRIETREHLNFLLQLVNSSNVGIEHAWIGASRRNRSDYSHVWLETGEIVPSFIWAQGQPDQFNITGHAEDCASVNPLFNGANDLPETSLIPFICTAKLGHTFPTTIAEETTESSIRTTTIKPTTEIIDPGFCAATGAGLFPDPHDCQKYHLCELNAVGDLWDWIHTCPRDLVWCPESEECDTNEVCPCS